MHAHTTQYATPYLYMTWVLPVIARSIGVMCKLAHQNALGLYLLWAWLGLSAIGRVFMCVCYMYMYVYNTKQCTYTTMRLLFHNQYPKSRREAIPVLACSDKNPKAEPWRCPPPECILFGIDVSVCLYVCMYVCALYG